MPTQALLPSWSGSGSQTAASIRCSAESSCLGVVAPSGVFVVDGPGLQAAVKDADEAVAEFASAADGRVLQLSQPGSPAAISKAYEVWSYGGGSWTVDDEI